MRRESIIFLAGMGWLGAMSGCAAKPPVPSREASTEAAHSPSPIPGKESPATSLEGSIDRRELERRLDSYRSEFNSCYRRGFKEGESYRSGQIITQFIIGPDGRATTASITKSSLAMPPVETCILRVIRSIDFPIPSGGGQVKVEFPFDFGTIRSTEER